VSAAETAGAVISIRTPRDYLLRRDACSYGYFLLAPNYWDTRGETLWRVLTLRTGKAALVRARQGAKAGSPLRVAVFGAAIDRDGRADVRAQLSRMLRLDEDERAAREFHALDPRFAKPGRSRLMRSPSMFEDVIKTVTSCNVTWPSTVTMNARLCEVVGTPVKLPRRLREALAGKPVHAFPTAGQLARARPATLRARCRVGYRDARIIELARLFTLPPSRGGIDQTRLQDPRTPDDEVYKTLIDLPGIGPYAAANIMQLMGRYARLPLDTESVRHGKTVLGLKGSGAAIMKRMARHYAPFGAHAFRSYWFELWEFYERKHGPSWTWERDTTGRMFTAALLKKG